MRLYVMRHGPAEDSAPSGRDADRTLSDAGTARVRAVARELSRRGERPERVFSSPLVRARQTAAIVHEVLRIEHPVDLRDELAPSEHSASLARALASATSSALLVSHAPDVTLLVQSLTGARAPAFSAGMVIAVDLTKTGATSVFTLDPASLTDE